jgi:hypothetical protein
VGLVFPAAVAQATVYPVNQCVGRKQAEAGRYCRAALSAYAGWLQSQDDAALDASLARAGDRLADEWSRADARSLNQGSDCVDTTVSAAGAVEQMDLAIEEVALEISDGLDLGATSDARCGASLLGAAAVKCEAILKAEGQHIRQLSRDADGSRLAQSVDRASGTFGRAWEQATRSGCPTTATEEGIETLVDALADDVVHQTIVSPNVDDTQFTTYSPTGTVRYLGMDLTPTCIFDTPYHFFAKRGSVNKLLMYYQGGGACWEQLTCSVPVCDDDVNPEGGDNPNNFSSGFADLANPDNPFRDWNIVFVSYCSCDVHFGNASQDYDNFNSNSPLHVEHRGYQNARVVEKWAREHFVNPEAVFVTGSSAGAYGAVFHGPVLQLDPWPASQFHVLGDAGNGVITPDFLRNEFENWNFSANLPKQLPELQDPIDDGTGMVGFIDLAADIFPDANWAHYSTAFDGGTGGQTGFYNVMLNDSDPLAALTWWEGSCAFNQVMREQAFETAALAPENYRYYIGSGSRHTMWGSNKVYGDTTGGVPTIVGWIRGMLASAPGAPDPAWENVEASPFNVLLPGDAQPPVLPTPPFEMSGSDVVVNCP